MRLFFVFLLFFCSFSLSAQRYTGVLSAVTVNQKTYSDLKTQIFTLQLDQARKGVLKGKIAAIGKMPGYVEIELPVRLVGQQLHLQNKKTKAGRFHLKVGGNLAIVLDDWQGELEGSNLRFRLRCHCNLAFVTIAKVSLQFDGQIEE